MDDTDLTADTPLVPSAGHTPGPWTLTHKRGDNFAVQCFEVRGMMGDSPNVYPIFNRDTSAIDGTVIYTSPANARLIAAAPELLEVAQQALFWLEGAARQKAVDAIAKATGAA